MPNQTARDAYGGLSAEEKKLLAQARENLQASESQGGQGPGNPPHRYSPEDVDPYEFGSATNVNLQGYPR
jgi:hypothetical protein